ncbi:MAG: YkvA family protein [Saprospiraceae bacterium]|nr:YkvA family protein [Saprospiraceae bacterium]
MKKNRNSLVKRGLIVSKTLLYRQLLIRVGGFLSNPHRIKDLLISVQRKLDAPRSSRGLVSDLLRYGRLFYSMITSWFSGDYRGLSTRNAIMIMAALFYFLTPLDVIPDVIPLVGFLDDVSLLAWLFLTLSEEVRHFETWQKIQQEDIEDTTYEELYELAQVQQIEGRSNLDKEELLLALRSSN